MDQIGARIVQSARSMVGKPYVHRGRDERGVDCAGLIIVAKEAGFGRREKFVGTPTVPTSASLRALMDRFADCVPEAEAAPGDVVVMLYHGNSQHVGIFTGTSVVHATEGRGVVENPIAVLSKRIVGYYRMRRN